MLHIYFALVLENVENYCLQASNMLKTVIYTVVKLVHLCFTTSFSTLASISYLTRTTFPFSCLATWDY